MPPTAKSSDRLTVHSEVVILGGGPAGVSCAVERKVCGVDSLILERAARLGGQLPEIPTAIPNLASGHVASGKDMQDRLCRAAEQAGLKIEYGQDVSAYDLTAKRLYTGNSIYTYNFLFVATGYRLQKLESLEGLEHLSNDLAYRTGSLQEDYVDKRVIVVGGGESALYEALEREKTARSITLVVRSGSLKSRPALVKEALDRERIRIIYNHEIQSLHGDVRLEIILLRSTVDDTTMTVSADKLVAKIGYSPNTELFVNQVEMDSRGHIKVGPGCHTSITGVLAGGDIVTPGYDRIATAMGHGSTAAGWIKNTIQNEGRIIDARI